MTRKRKKILVATVSVKGIFVKRLVTSYETKNISLKSTCTSIISLTKGKVFVTQNSEEMWG